MRQGRVLGAVAAAALAVGLAGCSSTRDARTEAAPSSLVEAEASIRTAEQLGAEGSPDAARHLALARAEVKRAHELWDDGKKAEAHLSLQRAEADAALAMALAREAPARAAAEAAKREADAAQTGSVR